jgi:hypothetical protein
VKEKYGDMTDEEYFKDLFKDGPTLCGQTCAYLTTGKGKELRGLFLGNRLSFRTVSPMMLTTPRLPTRCCETSRNWSRNTVEGESQHLNGELYSWILQRALSNKYVRTIARSDVPHLYRFLGLNMLTTDTVYLLCVPCLLASRNPLVSFDELGWAM